MAETIPPEMMEQLRTETKGPSTIVLVAFFTVFAIATVALRCYTRLRVQRHWGVEEVLIVVATVLSIAMGAFMIKQVQAGNGRHAMFVSMEDASLNLLYLYWSILLYCLALTLTKLSILFQYRRIFYASKPMRYATYATGAFVLAYGIESSLTGIFTCVPVQAFWDFALKPTARCIDQFPLYYSNASLNIVSDLLIAALPLPCIWKLQLPRWQKVAAMFVMAIGWIVCVVSILRLHALIVMEQHPTDPSYYGAETAWWSCIEVNLAIVCSSLPALRKFISHFWPSLGTRRSGYTEYYENSGVDQLSHSRRAQSQAKQNGTVGTVSLSTL